MLCNIELYANMNSGISLAKSSHMTTFNFKWMGDQPALRKRKSLNICEHLNYHSLESQPLCPKTFQNGKTSFQSDWGENPSMSDQRQLGLNKLIPFASLFLEETRENQSSYQNFLQKYYQSCCFPFLTVIQLQGIVSRTLTAF